ncbi:MAG: L,D-transpeptidase/peptidoglycan binding protein [Fusobacteriaceae bacterium]|jgi:lipoprotein-anchoring transpeptidase ErfK/SrfK|nr:L,D-transpeptidase/peptidoglycan binding protein [Fusobacteriaceae bacterium]
MESIVRDRDGALWEGISAETSEALFGRTTETALKRGGGFAVAKFFLFVLMLCGTGFLTKFYALHDAGRFVEGTTINGIDCGNLTYAQVDAVLKQQHADYRLALRFRDGNETTLVGAEFGYAYETGELARRIQEAQTPKHYAIGLLSRYPVAKYLRKPENLKRYEDLTAMLKQEVSGEIVYDKDLLREKLAALVDETQQGRATAPRDAYLDYIDGEFTVVKETAGNLIDREKVLDYVLQKMEQGETAVDLDAPGIYAEAAVKSDDPELTSQRDTLNDLARVNITYELPNDEKRVLDGTIVKNWLSRDNDGNLYVSEHEITEYISEYVDELAKELDTVGVDRPFISTLQGEIQVGGGTYGRKLDKKAEIRQLREEILAKVNITREPNYLIKEFSDENSGLGRTYIEIDLTNQKLWYYVDGELFLDTPLVSGTAVDKKRKTPGGIYTLVYKERNRVLRGERREDGTYEYESPVSYWMPFNGGIGLHDATWRGRFGGRIYLTNGSHGCINLPAKKAEAIYGIIDKNVPIVVFY